ncbi:MAG: S41 family peptidase [Bacteroidota bacterium]
MKYLSHFFLLIFSLSPTFSFAQNTEDDYHNRLYYLVKVWGYTKYFHPEIAQCNFEWDEVLLEKVEEIKSVSSDEEFNGILTQMLDDLGEVPTPSIPKEEIGEEFLYNLDLRWFEDDLLSEEVRNSLKQIDSNFRSRNHCLLVPTQGVGNPVFDDDQRFYDDGIDYPNEAVRVLSIARYWNIINYLFPYKYQMDQDWDVTLRQFIPAVAAAQNAVEYNLAMRELTTYINDSHAFFFSPTYGEWLGWYFAPFRLAYIEGQTVVTKIHSSVKDQLKVGDVILEVDGKTIEDARNQARKYATGSNEPTIERNINSLLVRGDLGIFGIKVSNSEGERRVTLSRKIFQEYESLYQDAGDSYQIKTAEGGCRMGYVHMGRLTREEVPQMFATMQKMPGIVIDIRNYPNGTLWTMVDYLYSNPINFSAFTIPDLRYPGKLDFQQHRIGRGGRPYKGKLLILFNEDTQSQAEFTIMGLELHSDALKIGSQTAAADGNVSYIYLPGNIRTAFSGLGVFYPDGRETQRIGIVPDIEFHPTIEGVRAGKDEMLEYALNCDLIGATQPIVDSEDGIEVFPNPTADQLNILSNREGAYIVQVRDALGRLLEERDIRDQNFSYSLDMKNYPSGMYFVTFLDGKEIFAVEQVVRE